MIVAPLDDVETIRAIVTHENNWEWISDDFSPSRDEYQPLIGEPYINLGVFNGDDCAGLFFLHPHSCNVYEWHTAILPQLRGRTEAAAGLGLAWLAENRPEITTLMTRVPVNNRLAYRLATRHGFHALGVLPRSFLKGGTLLDQHILWRELCH